MNIIFDLDDTLYDLHLPFAKAVETIFQNQYVLDIEELLIASRKYGDSIFPQLHAGEISLDEAGAYRIQKAMADYGYTISKEKAMCFQKSYRHYQDEIVISDSMRALLDWLEEKDVFLGILTNGKTEHQRCKIKNLGLKQWIAEEYMLVSQEIGYSKPHVQAFLTACQRWKLKPEDTWYIGDTYINDVEGAKRAGLHAIYFNRRHHQLPDSKYLADAVVGNEEELYCLLKNMLER